MGFSRRQFLVGAGAGAVAAAGGAYALVEHDVLPGKYKLDRFLGACDVSGHIPAVAPLPVRSGSFRSAARNGIEVGWSIAAPGLELLPGHRFPFCLALHGYGGDHNWPFTHLGLAHFLADDFNRSHAPMAIASVDGGNTNWHKRANGDDSNAMILFELLPVLAAQGLDTTRFAVWGWSYGGYGSLLLAEQLGPERIAAVCPTSAAVQPSFHAAPAGSFDSQADYDAYDVFAMRSKVDGIPIRMDVGSDDPLHKAVLRFRRGLTVEPEGGVSAGCHDETFWIRHAADELTFIRQHLAR